MKKGKEFYNLRFGKCYLIDEKEGCYLVYASGSVNNNNYIVCGMIDSTNALINEKIFTNLESARKYFNER